MSLLPSALFAQSIRTETEHGRRVFVNDGAAAPARAPAVAASSPRQFVYWSNVEKRWKPVPTPSRGALRRAREAAAEVQSFVDRRSPASGVQSGPAVSATLEASQSASLLRRSSATSSAGRAVSSQPIDRIIAEAAARHHVDERLVRAVVQVESNFNPRAVSRKGAMGLMQLMPETARRFNVTNPFDPQQNVEAGVQHLKRLLENFGGDVRLTLAAYNAGEGAVARNKGVPPYVETQNYVRKISGLYGSNGISLFTAAPIRASRSASGVVMFSNVD